MWTKALCHNSLATGQLLVFKNLLLFLKMMRQCFVESYVVSKQQISFIIKIFTFSEHFIFQSIESSKYERRSAVDIN